MPKYTVHIYREMRLRFDGIEADSVEAAAHEARDLSLKVADEIDECDGVTFAALVDVEGDEEYEQSRTVEFEGERLRNAAPKLLEALNYLLEQTVDMDLKYGVGLSEGEEDARAVALAAIALATPDEGDAGQGLHKAA